MLYPTLKVFENVEPNVPHLAMTLNSSPVLSDDERLNDFMLTHTSGLVVNWWAKVHVERQGALIDRNGRTHIEQ